MPIQTSYVKNFAGALRRVWNYAFWGEDPTQFVNVPICLNSSTYPGEYATGMNVAGTAAINMIGVDGSNNVVLPGPTVMSGSVTINNPAITEINNQFINPTMLRTVTYNEQNNSSLITSPFFIADQAYTITAISYVHKTQGSAAGAVVSVTKDTGTTAPGAGVATMTGTFDAHGTANATVVNATLTATAANLTLAVGDRLSVLFAGTLTALAGVVITVSMIPTVAGEVAPVFWAANGDIATTSFFQANRDIVVTGVKAVYGTAFAGGVTIDIIHDTGTTAAGAGTSILSAAMSGAAAINTVITPALTATTAQLTLNAGDRLSAKFSATTTGALLCIVVSYQPLYIRKEVTWFLAPNGQQQIAQYFFIAERNYEVVDGSCIFDVAAGGAAKIAITIDKGTTAPGAGNVTQTDNANAGFDLNAAARTTQYMTPAVRHLRLLSPGDRLGLKVTGAAQAIADVAITVSLLPNY
jgi:hypothetical protein